MAKPAAEDPLVSQAFKADQHVALARAVEQLTPEEAAYFLVKLERAIKKRKIQVLGYLVAMGAWVLAMVFALAYFGIASGFVGWVFLVPFAVVGLVLWAFGKWADKVGAPPAIEAVEAAAEAAGADTAGADAAAADAASPGTAAGGPAGTGP